MSTGSIDGQGTIDRWRDAERRRHSGKVGGAGGFELDPTVQSAPVQGVAAGKRSGAKDEVPSGTISVDMPNGFKVSGTHIGGGSAFGAQLLGSMESMIAFLNDFKPTGSGGAPGTGTTDNRRCLDTFHADLGDGESVTLRYGNQKDGGNTDASAMEAMADAIQRIIGRYKPHKQPDLADLYGQLDPPKKESA